MDEVLTEVVHLQEWHVQAPPRPSTHSGGSSCIATLRAPPHPLRACAGIARAGRKGEMSAWGREGERQRGKGRKTEGERDAGKMERDGELEIAPSHQR